MHRLPFTCATFLLIILAVLPAAGFAQVSLDDKSKPLYVIVLDDGSQSMEKYPQANPRLFLSHLLKIADLAEADFRLAVIQFGGAKQITVHAGSDGLPTAAFESLQQKLLQAWKPPAGYTPMATGMEKAVGMVQKIPADAPIVIILISDGEPKSYVLQPTVYPDVKAAKAKQIANLIERHRDKDPQFAKTALQHYETLSNTVGSDAWKALYQIQEPQELDRTLSLARVLKNRGARLISVAYDTLPQVKEIHAAGGGAESDFLTVNPANQIIEHLHSTGLTQLPRLLVQKTMEFPPVNDKFTTKWEIPIEQIGTAFVATVVFGQPIAKDADFTLEAEVDSRRLAFSKDNTAPNRLLVANVGGNIAGAIISVDRRPSNGTLTLHFSSGSQSVHPPQATVYVHLKNARGPQGEYSTERCATRSAFALHCDGATTIPIVRSSPVTKPTRSICSVADGGVVARQTRAVIACDDVRRSAAHASLRFAIDATRTRSIRGTDPRIRGGQHCFFSFGRFFDLSSRSKLLDCPDSHGDR